MSYTLPINWSTKETGQWTCIITYSWQYLHYKSWVSTLCHTTESKGQTCRFVKTQRECMHQWSTPNMIVNRVPALLHFFPQNTDCCRQGQTWQFTITWSDDKDFEQDLLHDWVGTQMEYSVCHATQIYSSLSSSIKGASKIALTDSKTKQQIQMISVWHAKQTGFQTKYKYVYPRFAGLSSPTLQGVIQENSRGGEEN